MPASGRLAFVALKGKNLKPQETRKAGGKFIHKCIKPYMHYWCRHGLCTSGGGGGGGS